MAICRRAFDNPISYMGSLFMYAVSTRNKLTVPDGVITLSHARASGTSRFTNGAFISVSRGPSSTGNVRPGCILYTFFRLSNGRAWTTVPPVPRRETDGNRDGPARV